MADDQASARVWDTIPARPVLPSEGIECRFDWACWRLQMTRRQVADRIRVGDWPPTEHRMPMTDDQQAALPGWRRGISRAWVEDVAAAMGIPMPEDDR